MEANKHNLNVHRLRINYLISNQHSYPANVKSHLDESLEKDLSHTLSDFVSQLFLNSDESMWFIRRLETDSSVNASWDREQIAQVITQQLTTNLVTTIKNENRGEDVLYFSNREAFLRK